MSRSISSTFQAALNAAATSEAVITLLTIDHDDLDEPMRFCDQPTGRLTETPLTYGLVSNGETYSHIPFVFQPPQDADGVPPQCKVIIDNIHRNIVEIARSTTERATVSIDYVLASDVDSVEISLPNFKATAADIEDGAVILTLVFDDLAGEAFPGRVFDPAGFPGLF